MRAFVITGPGRAEVQEVEPPVPGPGEVVVEVERAGVCGTDMEFYSGAMTYLRTGEARYPVRIGHEWAGVVREAGDGVDPAWLGRRVTGDTMLGCGAARAASAAGSTCAPAGTRSASATAGRARSPSGFPCPSAPCSPCPAPSIPCWARWWSPAGTRCGPWTPPPSARGSGCW
ncbi:alcohol dehydrogenase catalytic domain-containing protein [Nonomuraea thailandensis]